MQLWHCGFSQHCASVGQHVLRLLDRNDVQCSNAEDRRCYELLLQWHLKLRNSEQWNYQYRNVRSNIKCSRCGHADCSGDASTVNGWMVYLLSRRACKDESQAQGQVEEEIGHDQYPDGQVEGASFVVREEDGLDLM